MLELEEALDKIFGLIPPTQEEVVRLDEAYRRVLAQDVIAGIDLPGFDNSAMDGYAVRAGDVREAAAEKPVTLRLRGRVAAGDAPGGPLMPGTCVRVFTGSAMPPGADAVVMQEDTTGVAERPEQVRIHDRVVPGENIRRRGEDIRRGTRIGCAGEIIRSNGLALLAAQGISTVAAGRRPVVGLIATGSELQEPGQAPGPGKIFESNRSALAPLVRAAGGIPRIYPLVRDTVEATGEALATAFAECDLVVTSGGVSVGETDFVKPAFEQIGGTLEFWRVAMKPGRPFVLGRLGKRLLCGLPGNPVSAFVTFLLLVRPAVLRWQGAADIELPRYCAEAGERLSNPGDRRQFLRIKVDSQGRVYSAGSQGSHCLGSLAAADGLVDMGAGSTLEIGQSTSVLYWE